MDNILQGVPGVVCYIDDILVTGDTDAEHLRNLELVLLRLRKHGVKLKKSKCRFMQDSVEYLGHRLDSEGQHPTDDKLRAVIDAPTPKNVQQLRSFLGLLNYYCKFVPNLASILYPLNQLLQKNHKWSWTPDCVKAFQAAKEGLISSQVLVHYDPNLPIKVAADASAYGLGAVISHVLPDQSERPIAFASRSLTKSERNYSQLDKEALALVFSVKKFHDYLYGRKFTLLTDHKPLLSILGSKQGVPPLAAARLQRWAVVLSAYTYDIVFKPTKAHCNADALSRLPLPESATTYSGPTEFNISQIYALPVTSVSIQSCSRKDPLLSRVIRFTRSGWPSTVAEELKPYHQRRHELTIEAGCLLWGIRVVIPKHLQRVVLQELHLSHPGVSRMKSIARSYFWWPGLDKEIENLVSACTACQAVRQAPASAPLHPWIWPTKPWQRVHVDFAGPFKGKSYLLLVDAHSKWPEIHEMSTTTASRTIIMLRQLFSRYGLPEHLVSDNGPQFTSDEFADFMKCNGVKHIRCSPYHPSSNGAVERLVRTFKQSMKASSNDHLSSQQRLQNFLLTYRSTPHSTTGETPSTLFLGRRLRTRLDLLVPSLEERVAGKQANQKSQHDVHSKLRQFEPGQHVMVRDKRPTAPTAWIPGVIVQQKGPLTYVVKVLDGLLWKRHVDHLRLSSPPDGQEDSGPYPKAPIVPPAPPPADSSPSPRSPKISPPPRTPPKSPSSTPPPSRYPRRIRKEPDRFSDTYMYL